MVDQGPSNNALKKSIVRIHLYNMGELKRVQKNKEDRLETYDEDEENE